MENRNHVHITWECYDRPHHERGRWWYVLMTIAGLGLLIYAVLSANFLFAFILILFALVTYISSVGERVRLPVVVDDAGIHIGAQSYPFRSIRRFWFIYEPPQVKTLYFETGNWMTPRVGVDLDDANPNDVRTVLGQFVREDLEEKEEPISDYIGRVWKL